MMNHSIFSSSGLALTVALLAAGCGGSSGDGTGAGTTAVSVSGTVAYEADGTGAGIAPRGSDTLRVRATGSSGAVHATEANDGGHFSLMLPPNESYVMGFEHRDGMGGDMHFAGYMVFRCGDGESDHFLISDLDRSLDLGTIVIRRDGSFARPQRGPLGQMDHDQDGTPEDRDPDTRCTAVGDTDHDGFYDDDMDRDGHHDDDMDRDGYHDCEMDMMGHDDENDDECPAPSITRTPMGSPGPNAAATTAAQMSGT